MFQFDHIYQHAAAALALWQVPDFSQFDPDDVFDAFGYSILVSQYNEWLPYFRQLILDASDNQINIVESPFYTGIRGLNKTYLLTKDGVEQRLIISVGLPPIELL